MENAIFARIAAIVGSASMKRPVSAVYDNATARYVSVSADTTKGGVSGYDTALRCFFAGNSKTDLSFYDTATRAQIKLILSGDEVQGFNYATKSFFRGHVYGKNLVIRDDKLRNKKLSYIF